MELDKTQEVKIHTHISFEITNSQILLSLFTFANTLQLEIQCKDLRIFFQLIKICTKCTEQWMKNTEGMLFAWKIKVHKQRFFWSTATHLSQTST